jgi:hypothetical protein
MAVFSGSKSQPPASPDAISMPKGLPPEFWIVIRLVPEKLGSLAWKSMNVSLDPVAEPMLIVPPLVDTVTVAEAVDAARHATTAARMAARLRTRKLMPLFATIRRSSGGAAGSGHCLLWRLGRATFGDIQATYGDGSDLFRFLNVCVPTATVDLGEGTNEYQGQGCDNSAITVSAGSGQDTLNG